MTAVQTLVLGGAASGKSAFAEKLALETAREKQAPLFYLATLDASSGGDTQERIRRHRAARADKGFVTLEWTGSPEAPLPSLPVPGREGAGPVLLIEDFGNLVANFLYPPGQTALAAPADADRPAAGSGGNAAADSPDPVTAAVDALLARLEQLTAPALSVIAVSNEISLGGPLPPGSRFYGQVLAALNMRWAAASSAVYIVIAGIPLAIKGPLPLTAGKNLPIKR